MNDNTPIYQYDLEYNFIKKWKSGYEACNNLNMKKRPIIANLQGFTKSSQRFIWSYLPTLTAPVKEKLSIDENTFLDRNDYNFTDNTEYWKDIDGYENRYKISNHGNVFSILKNRMFTIQLKGGYYHVN